MVPLLSNSPVFEILGKFNFLESLVEDKAAAPQEMCAISKGTGEQGMLCNVM
jgi:hypothetical protein